MAIDLEGEIISPASPECPYLGILIVHIKHIRKTNMISAYVKYFRTDSDAQDIILIDDSEFKCPYEYFFKNFVLMQTYTDSNGEEAYKWVSMYT